MALEKNCFITVNPVVMVHGFILLWIIPATITVDLSTTTTSPSNTSNRFIQNPLINDVYIEFVPSHYDVQLKITFDNSTLSKPKKGHNVPGKVRMVGTVVRRREVLTTSINSSTTRIILYGRKLSPEYKSVSIINLSKSRRQIQVRSFDKIPFRSLPPAVILDIPRDFKRRYVFFDDLLLYSINAEGSELTENGDELEITMDYNATIFYLEKASKYDGLVYSVYNNQKGALRAFVRTKQIAGVRNRGKEHDELFPSPLGQTISDATIALTVIRNKGYTCLSNTQLISSYPDPKNPDLFHDCFSKSIRMSPSMLSLVVSDFPFVEIQYGKNKAVRVHAPKQVLEKSQTALVAGKILSFYEGYLNDSSPTAPSKMDIVWGGKRGKNLGKLSWGLYIDTQQWLFPSPKDTDFIPKQLLPEMISIPLAYQYLWSTRNQPLVTFLHRKALQAASLEGMILKERVDDIIDCERSSALFYDTKRGSSFPRRFGTLRQNWGKPWRNPLLKRYFSTEEEKDVLLLRMLESTVTPGIFEVGLQKYLRKISNGEDSSLYETLQSTFSEAGIAIEDIAFEKIWQPIGNKRTTFPLVNFGLVNQSHVELSQKTFFKSFQGKTYEQIRWIPIEVQQQVFWLGGDDLDENSTKRMAFPLNKPKFLSGYNSGGYYRITYDPALLDLVIEKLEEEDFGGITPLTRSRLLDDYFFFAFLTNKSANLQTNNSIFIERLLNLTRYLDKETNMAAWKAVMVNLQYFETSVGGHSDYPKLERYFRKKLNSALTTFGFGVVEQSENFHNYSDLFTPSDENPWSVADLRGKLLNWACKMGSEICGKIGRQFFEFWRHSTVNNRRADPFPSYLSRYPLASAVSIGVGGDETVQFLLARFKYPPKTLQDKKAWRLDMMKAVSDVPNEDALRRLAISSYTLEVSSKYLLKYIARNPRGHRVVLDFLKTHFGKIVKELDDDEISEFVEDVVPRLRYTSEEQILDVETILKQNEDILERNVYERVRRTLNASRKNDVVWLRENSEAVFRWLTAELNE